MAKISKKFGGTYSCGHSSGFTPDSLGATFQNKSTTKIAILATGNQIKPNKQMKLTKIFAAAMVVLMTASCGILGGGNSAASGSTSGQASGAALKNLYSQYKTDGKIDVTNLNNVINLATLANGIQGLKGQDDKTAFYTDFAMGLILGSNNLVTQTTAPTVTNSLSGLANTDLSAITNAATNAIAAGLISAANTAAQQTAAQQAAAQQAAQQAAAQQAAAAQTAANTGADAAAAAMSAIGALAGNSDVTNTVNTITSILGLFK